MDLDLPLVGCLDCRLSVAFGEHNTVAGSIATIRFAAAVAVWAMVLLLTVDDLGADITGLVAGLGSCAKTDFGDSSVRPLLADLTPTRMSAPPSAAAVAATCTLA